MGAQAVDLIVDAVRQRGARLVGITGGIAAGKSTMAAQVARALDEQNPVGGTASAKTACSMPPVAVVSTDGFLLSNASLAEAGLAHRKGFPESFDHLALGAFIDGWRTTGRAQAPLYSHLHYDVVGTTEVDSERLVLDGLHLGHPALGVRDRLDLLVHLDAATDDLARWYLARFQQLRTTAAADETAFLYPYREMAPDVLDGMAMDVWRTLNVIVLDQEIRPHESAADLVIRLGPGHEVLAVETPTG